MTDKNKIKLKPGPKPYAPGKAKNIALYLRMDYKERDYLQGIASEYDATFANVVRAHMDAAKKSDYLPLELDKIRGTKTHKQKKVEIN